MDRPLVHKVGDRQALGPLALEDREHARPDRVERNVLVSHDEAVGHVDGLELGRGEGARVEGDEDVEEVLGGDCGVGRQGGESAEAGLSMESVELQRGDLLLTLSVPP